MGHGRKALLLPLFYRKDDGGTDKWRHSFSVSHAECGMIRTQMAGRQILFS